MKKLDCAGPLPILVIMFSESVVRTHREASHWICLLIELRE